MKVWIALLRGINVGGKNRLPMKELVSKLSDLGLTDINTYIQSGNVVFHSDATDGGVLSKEIQKTIHAHFGFEPNIVVLEKDSFLKIMAANPFADEAAENGGKSLHVFFLSEAPTNVDIETIDALKQPSEQWKLGQSAFYLFAPDGFYTSKLGARIEKVLGVPATARNWRTVTKISAMLE